MKQSYKERIEFNISNLLVKQVKEQEEVWKETKTIMYLVNT